MSDAELDAPFDINAWFDEQGARGWTQNQSALGREVFRLFEPPEDLTMSEWAEKYYMLESGRFVAMGFQPGILDAFTDPTVEEISFMKSARVGATESMIIACVYYAAQDPMHLAILEPTEDDCKGISTDKVEPAYIRCPQTKDMVFSRSTLVHKVFPGGSLKILAAKSPRNLRRHDIDILLLDECDGYETTAEGDPIELAIKRTETSNRRKIMYASTPVNVQTSNINRKWLDSDQRYFYVPCPHCGSYQTLDFGQMRIGGHHVLSMRLEDVKNTDNWIAYVECKDCHAEIYEGDKAAMLSHGEWRATQPFRGNAGFHINTMYSTFANASWQKMTFKYLQAKRSPDTLQTFHNTWLGIPWADNLDNLDEDAISKRVMPGDLEVVPEWCLMITVGVDVQRDRAEVTYIGWGDDRTHVLAHRKVYGDPTSTPGAGLWAKLDDTLAETFLHELGGRISISAAAVDSGNWTQQVYAFCAGKQMRGIYAIKGTPGPRPIWTESKIRPGEGAKLYNVGTDTAKTTLMQRLAIENAEEPGYITFCPGLEFEYFNQLLSEYRKVEYVSGRPKFVWERKQGRRAETLDCFVYALAAFTTESPNWERLREALSVSEGEKKSGFGSLGSAMSKL